MEDGVDRYATMILSLRTLVNDARDLRVGSKVKVTSAADETIDVDTIGRCGEIVGFDYDHACGQHEEDDPMIVVLLEGDPDGTVHFYWAEELRLDPDTTDPCSICGRETDRRVDIVISPKEGKLSGVPLCDICFGKAGASFQ